MDHSQAHKHAVVVIIRGLPGSGKSFLAAELYKQFEAGQLVALDPDATDYASPEYAQHTKALAAEGVDPRLHAYRYLRGKAYEGIANGKVIIWNQPFTNLEIFNKMMAKLQAQADEHNVTLHVLVVEVMVDPALARARVNNRKQAGGHGPSDATFERFHNDFHSFEAHGYHTLTVDGGDEVAVSVAAIVRAVADLQ